ncbi:MULTISPECIES: hypothetical protein [Thermoanaerobacterium]|uniref:DUF5673 domain-containing protein n=2 Tax=Thermoanaerobacterium TaxID=28895 RepID=W9EEG9_9THEO|nr:MULTISPECIES: hypothetical protein [Thermoanaerobacterium]AFK87153.1 hypothetical protein Tsac_2149 [Thermoanaerobacterium saccharolyticum JW/SL-YS485]ETO38154.1 hypothetical protein V518_1689 [Thermoanaerobacterium aotearoense SCUT27]
MKYYMLDRIERLFLYFVTFIILLSVAVLFVFVFVDVNMKGINVELSVLWWILYIILSMALTVALFSIGISQVILLEDYFVVSLGIMGFARIRYDNIAGINEIEKKINYKRGINLKNDVCSLIISKKSLLEVQLKSPIKIYYFLLFDRYANDIVFSAPNLKVLKEEINKKM